MAYVKLETRKVCVRFPDADLWLEPDDALKRYEAFEEKGGPSLSIVDTLGFGNVELGWSNLEELDAAVDEYGLAFFAAWEYFRDWKVAREACQDKLEGHYKSGQDWAHGWCEDNAGWYIDLPEAVRPFIDMALVLNASAAGGLEAGGVGYVPSVTVLALEGHKGVWVFRSN